MLQIIAYAEFSQKFQIIIYAIALANFAKVTLHHLRTLSLTNAL